MNKIQFLIMDLIISIEEKEIILIHTPPQSIDMKTD
jgi:hypothetical protein